MKSPCKYPGCRQLLDAPGYCDNHLDRAPNRARDYDQRVRRYDPALALAAAIRGSHRWRSVRRKKLSAYPLCEDPFGQHGRRGVTETALQVHHIVGLAVDPDKAYDMDNLMSVCTRCHAMLERDEAKNRSSE